MRLGPLEEDLRPASVVAQEGAAALKEGPTLPQLAYTSHLPCMTACLLRQVSVQHSDRQGQLSLATPLTSAVATQGLSGLLSVCLRGPSRFA